MESEQACSSRNGTPLAKLIGYGTTTDGKDMVKPDLDGVSSAMQAALDDADIDASKIDYINAHGTGTLLNDSNEIAAIKKVFGQYAHDLNISSTKPITGHVLGGTGAIEAIITIMAMQNNFVPPTINYEETDENCELNITANIGQNKKIQYALSNSFAFGGINAVLAFQST